MIFRTKIDDVGSEADITAAYTDHVHIMKNVNENHLNPFLLSL
jgi:hypothetical protein